VGQYDPASGFSLDDFYEANPTFTEEDVVAVVGALVWLDRHYGLDNDSNIVVVHPGLALSLPLLVSFRDAGLAAIAAQLIPAFTDESWPGDELLEQFYALLGEEPFEVTFTAPEAAPQDEVYQYPATITDSTRTMRLMSGQELASNIDDLAFTTTASGERIVLG